MTLEEQVRQAVARGWCDPRNSGKEMDTDLADAISAEVVKSFTPDDFNWAALQRLRKASP
jgi:hypothetical protein